MKDTKKGTNTEDFLPSKKSSMFTRIEEMPERPLRLDVRSIICWAMDVVMDRSNKEKKYLTTILTNWIDEWGEQIAIERFIESVLKVWDQRSRGRIRKNAAAYLGEVLREEREANEGGYKNRFHHRAIEGIDDVF